MNGFEWKKTVHFPIGVVLKSNENIGAIQCELLNTCCTFLYTQSCTFCGQHLLTYRYMQKLTRLNLMHRCESYGIAQQLMPWFHRTSCNCSLVRSYIFQGFQLRLCSSFNGWFEWPWPSVACVWTRQTNRSLVQKMYCRLRGVKTKFKRIMMTYRQ